MSNAELIAEARRWPSDMGEGATLNAFADALEAVERDLAAAQAVIAEASRLTDVGVLLRGTKGAWIPASGIRAALSQSPADALQAAKEAAWGEGLDKAFYDASYTFDGLLEQNPYRKDKTDE